MSEIKESSERELSNSTSHSLSGIPRRQNSNLQVKSLTNQTQFCNHFPELIRYKFMRSHGLFPRRHQRTPELLALCPPAYLLLFR